MHARKLSIMALFSARSGCGDHRQSQSDRAVGRVGRVGDHARVHLGQLQWQCGRLCWPGEGEGQLVQQILSTLDSGIKVSLPFLLCFH